MPGFDFEAEVLRVARAKWPLAEFSGPVMFEKVERDGYFETPDAIHVIECTELPKKEKAVHDCKKISDMIQKLRPRFPMKSCKGWFITKDEPTAEQRQEAKRYANDLVCCSFKQFSSTLVDSGQYLELRTNHKFGSAADPETDSVDVRNHPFIAIDLLEVEGTKKSSFEEFTTSLEAGPIRSVVLGDLAQEKA